MNLITPIAIGFVGSMHCLGMCGPIALALPLGKYSGVKRYSGILLYNTGRIFTYALLGAFFGFVGKSFYLAGFQQQFSIFLGILILLGLFIPSILPKQSWLTRWWNKLFGSLYSEMSNLLRKGSFISLFAIGFINGFLPCGLVYLGLAGSLAQIEITDSILFMLLFGFGTLPAMFGVAWASKWVSISMRNKIKRASPYFIAFFGLILILRGLNLGLFLSPRIEAVGTFIQSCL